MEIPKLEENQHSIILAENSTGIILNSDLSFFNNEFETNPFQVFENLEIAEFYAQDLIKNNPTIECSIYNFEGKFIKVIKKETEKINIISNELEKLNKTEWKAFIEGRDFTSGSSFIMVNTEFSREKDIEVLGANNDEINFIANSKENIRFLIEEVKKLQKKLNHKDYQ